MTRVALGHALRGAPPCSAAPYCSARMAGAALRTARPLLLGARDIRSLPMASSGARFASTAAAKVEKVLEQEEKHEKEQAVESKAVKSFLSKSPFKFVESPGDVNMALERELGDKVVRIEWQLQSPFDPDVDAEGGDGEVESEQESTEMSVTVENKAGDAGIVIYCSTQTGEEHRYIIGNVKSYSSAKEKENVSSYNGPDFEDLDDKLQEALDEYLAELGMSTEVCDFIDAMAIDKEQREYIRWLGNMKKFMKGS